MSAAIGLALSGLILLLPMIFAQPRWAVSSRWLASFALLGLAVGTSVDMAAVGTPIGFALGLAVALHNRPVDQGAIPNLARRS
jgi:hypothetical protein